MRNNNISTKIRYIGILFLFLMISVISTTIYLNEKNRKDALIINIAGKQRMLTQNISKNIFYLYQHKNSSLVELENSTTEFIYNLNSLKNGNDFKCINKVPTKEIKEQINKVEYLWEDFNKNISSFKELLSKQDTQSNEILKKVVNSIHSSNMNLLNEVDKLVSMYTFYSEEKSNYIKYVQYFFALLIFLVMFYSFLQLKSMEENAKKFLEESKKMIENSEEYLQPIKIEAENEIVEATNTINCFIEKINSAMEYSADAIEHSKNASMKLEEISEEFDKVINEISNSTDISKQINRSEDIVIQSYEDLMNSTKKLQDLKNELDKLLKSCNTQINH